MKQQNGTHLITIKKMNYNNISKGIILIVFGSALNNIIWYFRLSNPKLMKEFIYYFERDGAKVFLDFNMFNYVPLVIMIIIYLIHILISRRRTQNAEAKK